MIRENQLNPLAIAIRQMQTPHRMDCEAVGNVPEDQQRSGDIYVPDIRQPRSGIEWSHRLSRHGNCNGTKDSESWIERMAFTKKIDHNCKTPSAPSFTN